ncbi:MAG: histidine phosphatase family protein [Acidimicrobiales bacterium]|nr:histidine phosphatase family protein [Acidimicrobiales bacterium]
MIARLLLVRHGQSTWNAEHRWQGTEDPPLSEFGQLQARQAAEAIGTFDLIAASTLERAMTTATIIADHLGIGPVVGAADLIERYAGGFQSLTRDDIRVQFPGYLEAGRRPDGYEPDDVVVERATGALARIAAQVGNDGTALVVSHGGVIHALERLADAPREGRLPNLGGRWFDVGPGTFRAGDDVLLVDEASLTVPDHL